MPFQVAGRGGFQSFTKSNFQTRGVEVQENQAISAWMVDPTDVTKIKWTYGTVSRGGVRRGPIAADPTGKSMGDGSANIAVTAFDNYRDLRKSLIK